MSRDADYVFVGAGVAGLSLAYHLVERGLRGRRLLLLDPRHGYENDRTFCSWNVVRHPFEALVSHRWERWSVRAGGVEIVRGTPGLAYEHLPAGAFYPFVRSALDAAGVELRLGVGVQEVVEEERGVRVETDAGTVRGAIAFDSRPHGRVEELPLPLAGGGWGESRVKPQALDAANPALPGKEAVEQRARRRPHPQAVEGAHRAREATASERARGLLARGGRSWRPGPAREITLLQHFEGWHVRVEEDRFDPGRAMLMDFDVPQDDGIAFVYVLPYGPREALVEATWFGGRVLDADGYRVHLERYMSSALGVSAWEVVRRERGVIPMTTSEPAARIGRRIYRIGLAGGMAKPSTGYAFQSIQRFSRELASSLDETELPEPPRPRPWRAATLDRIFLSYLERHPERAPTIFRALFERTDPALLVRFLSDQASVPECLRVMRELPFGPFTLETLRSARLWLR